jgi:hypothetical protein
MLFFRSEELVKAWCADRGATPGPSVRMDQLWVLAKTWYATRLAPEARRPSPAEMRGIFAGIGLTGPFWDPEARA